MGQSAEYDRGIKFFFRVIAGSGVPVKITDGNRITCVMLNEGPGPLRIGTPSGTLSSLGILLPSGTYHVDNYSDDDWWAIATTSSGTLSGYIVQGL